MRPLYIFTQYDLKELKLVYLTLYNSILKTPELIDLEFMSDLQKYLQGKTEKIGLDPLDHDTWINWLNNVKNTLSPSVSIMDRKVLPESDSSQKRKD